MHGNSSVRMVSFLAVFAILSVRCPPQPAILCGCCSFSPNNSFLEGRATVAFYCRLLKTWEIPCLDKSRWIFKESGAREE